MKKVQVDGLGEVTLKKSAKAKYIKLRVEPFKGVIVTVPTYLSYEFGLNAIMGKYDWLTSQLSTMKNKEAELKYKEEDFPIFSKNYRIELLRKEVETPKRAFKNGIANLFIPYNLSIDDIEIQNFISESVNKVLRTDAKIYLKSRIDFFANKFEISEKIASLTNLFSCLRLK